MKRIIFLLLLITWHIDSTVLIPGPATAATGNVATFNGRVTTTAFDRVEGVFYAGTTSAGDSTLQSATRSSQGVIPVFTAVSAETTSVEAIRLVAKIGQPAFGLAYVIANLTGPLQQESVNIVNVNTGATQASGQLLDSSGAAGSHGQVTDGIVGIASSSSFIFAAVRPGIMSLNTNFGATSSGIAVVAINQNTLALTQVPAINGDSGVKAQLLDPTIAPVNIGVAGNPTLFPNGTVPVPIIWDNQLQRLYVPLLVEVSANAGAGAKDIVVGQVLDQFGHLQINSIAPDTAFTAGNTHEIVGYLKTQSDVTQPFLSINNVAVMHCTTGPSYLIVNGDVGPQNTIGNLIYAIPLVDLGSPNSSIQGTQANKNSALVNGKFVTPALATADMTLNTDAAAMVGAGPVPFDPVNIISDIFVVDDTVYVALDTVTSASSDTGALYSQALFDQTGKVVRWTPWTRRAFPVNGFPSQSVYGPISSFAMDAYNGVAWAVDGQSEQIVRTTNWDNPQSTPTVKNTSLVGTLNAAITNPVTSVLDLDQSTPGFTNGSNSQPYRYALFGSTGMVAFAVTSQALNATLDSPQAVTLDYSQSGYFLVTELPTLTNITSLEYARQLPGVAQNYFFAGSSDGLYVFGDPIGAGFDANTLNLLSGYPFAGHSWVKIGQNILPGSILDIKTSGLALYVLAVTTTPTNPLQATLYRIPFQSTINAMFTPSNIFTIAASNTGIFSSVLLFSGMQIIMTSTTSEQLVLATTSGYYQSTLPGGVQAATSQANAQWQPSSNNILYYNGIAGVDNASRTGSIPTKVWPFAFTSTLQTNLTNQSSWFQTLGTTDSGPYVQIPAFFNANNTSGAFNALPLTTYFWSDGGRRLAVVNQSQSNCNKFPRTNVVCERQFSCPSQQLFCMPYDVTNWGISEIASQFLFGSPLNSRSRFYWIKDIGTTGILMAGTEKGVVALE